MNLLDLMNFVLYNYLKLLDFGVLLYLCLIVVYLISLFNFLLFYSVDDGFIGFM